MTLGALLNEQLTRDHVQGLLFSAKSAYSSMTSAMKFGEAGMARDSLADVEKALKTLEGMKLSRKDAKETKELRLDVVLFKAKYRRQIGLPPASQGEQDIFQKYKDSIIRKLRDKAASLGVPPRKPLLAGK